MTTTLKEMWQERTILAAEAVVWDELRGVLGEAIEDASTGEEVTLPFLRDGYPVPAEIALAMYARINAIAAEVEAACTAMEEMEFEDEEDEEGPEDPLDQEEEIEDD